jgi:hypothetical protein
MPQQYPTKENKRWCSSEYIVVVKVYRKTGDLISVIFPKSRRKRNTQVKLSKRGVPEREIKIKSANAFMIYLLIIPKEGLEFCCVPFRRVQRSSIPSSDGTLYLVLFRVVLGRWSQTSDWIAADLSSII